MCIDRLAFYHEDHVGESGIVDDFSHVLNQGIDCFIVYLILFELADVEDADIIEPLTAVEAAEDEELLHADDASRVSLPSSRGLLVLYGMAPPHGVSIEHV